MSLVRLLPAWLHGAVDYAVAIALIASALLIHATAGAVSVNLGLGSVMLIVSTLTKYPPGVEPALDFRVHSLFDYLGAAVLFAGPFVLGYWTSDSFAGRADLSMGAALLGVSLLTSYQCSPRRADTVAAT